jgi:hypothetical protein
MLHKLDYPITSPLNKSVTASFTFSLVFIHFRPGSLSFFEKDGSKKAPGLNYKGDGQGFPNQISLTTLSFFVCSVWLCIIMKQQDGRPDCASMCTSVIPLIYDTFPIHFNKFPMDFSRIND